MKVIPDIKLYVIRECAVRTNQSRSLREFIAVARVTLEVAAELDDNSVKGLCTTR